MANQIPMLQRILARNIRAARAKHGYSQQRLAEKAELSPGHMNDLEQGRKWVSADTLERLGDALGLQPFMLLLPPEYSSQFDAFNLLNEYAITVRESIDGALETSLRKILHQTRGESPEE